MTHDTITWGIGAANAFGNYGVKSGTKEQETFKQILLTESPFEFVDSAMAYGQLDRSFLPIPTSLKIGTKIKTADLNSQRKCIYKMQRELDELCIERYEYCLMHDLEWLSVSRSTLNFFDDLFKLELIGNVGASIYRPEEWFRIRNVYSWDIVQAPLNLLDQSFVPLLMDNDFSQRNTRFMARSLLLQGTLASRSIFLNRFPNFGDAFKELERCSMEIGGSLLVATIMLLKKAGVSLAVLGVDSVNHVAGLKHAILAAGDQNRDQANFEHLRIDLPEVIDPRLWR